MNNIAICDRIASSADDQQSSLKDVITVAQQVEIDQQMDRKSESGQPVSVREEIRNVPPELKKGMPGY